MSATNGSAVSLRPSRGLIAICMALALLASALFASTASAKKTPLTKTAYVALGDSLSFGYKGSTQKENEKTNKANCEAGKTAGEAKEQKLFEEEEAKCNPATAYEPGFVGEFAKKLAKTEKKAGHELQLLNLACPGETSGGLIGNGALGSALETARAEKSEPELRVSSPCAYRNLAGWPLKTELGGASELEVAVKDIENLALPVTAVTLQIGSNDELGAVGDCANPKYFAEHGFTSLLQCLQHEAGPSGYLYPGGLFAHIETNIGVSIKALRDAGYTGKIAVVGFYNPEALILMGSDALTTTLNNSVKSKVETEVFGANVKYVNVFPTINPEAALYKEGETGIEKAKLEAKEYKALAKYTEYPLHSDVHPTALGYKTIGKLLSAAF
jgi:lysophospholipase L1-like esterase